MKAAPTIAMFAIIWLTIESGQVERAEQWLASAEPIAVFLSGGVAAALLMSVTGTAK